MLDLLYRVFAVTAKALLIIGVSPTKKCPISSVFKRLLLTRAFANLYIILTSPYFCLTCSTSNAETQLGKRRLAIACQPLIEMDSFPSRTKVVNLPLLENTSAKPAAPSSSMVFPPRLSSSTTVAEFLRQLKNAHHPVGVMRLLSRKSTDLMVALLATTSAKTIIPLSPKPNTSLSWPPRFNFFNVLLLAKPSANVAMHSLSM
mmetsp:Transcript_5405/g.11902  ORF Transcript_5405/g.11902 Transcript_5405/m.11902 type:complete len:203 (+) Transcript_5405:636-1244(+)